MILRERFNFPFPYGTVAVLRRHCGIGVPEVFRKRCSARGAQGGYQLTKPPEEYTVGDILRTTEGSLAPVSCLEAGSGVCEMERACVTLEVWQQIEEAVNQVVDHITLADLVKRYHEKAGADYVI